MKKDTFKDVEQKELESEFDDENEDVLDFMNNNRDGYYDYEED
jgi:hypothetical protein